MTPSTLIRVSGQLLAELNEIRELNRCSYTQAIRYHSKGLLSIGAVITAKMKEIYILVEREYTISDLRNTQIHVKLSELRLAEAYLKKEIAIRTEAELDMITNESLTSMGLMDSEDEAISLLDRHMEDLAQAEADNNDLYKTKNQKKK